jgi:glycosyltransferase involved in cell wall biosynthesis
MTRHREPLRVAFVAGTLAQGGAEKQLTYMVAALKSAGARVQVYSLLAGGHFEPVLTAMGIPVVHVGQHDSPAVRVWQLMRALRHFRPHVVQAAHFYVNLYAALASRPIHAVSVGAIRSDGVKDLQDTGRWARCLLLLPEVLVVNSCAARERAMSSGVAPDRVHVIPNVLALPATRSLHAEAADGGIQAVAAGGLHPDKRFDRFIAALALARRRHPQLRGVIAGSGPERARLEQQASDLGLLPAGLRFEGHTPDLPALLRRSHMLALTSTHEGFPNVLLEAMAEGLPVVTTPAGDSSRLVQDRVTGYVVGFDDVTGLADRMVELAASAELRRRLGEAGRARVIDEFSPARLGDQLLATYSGAARRSRAAPLLSILEHLGASSSAERDGRCPA